MKQARHPLVLILVLVALSVAPAWAAPFKAELRALPGNFTAELTHPGRPGARYVIEQASSLAGPWTVALTYYGTVSNLIGGLGRLEVPLPPPPPPGPPIPPPPPAEARYEFWIGKTPKNTWCATLHRRQMLGGKSVWLPVHRHLTPGKDWSFQAISRPGGGTGLPWISHWEVPSPSGGKWAFMLDAFFGRMDLPQTPTLSAEEAEAFARLESSWQAIATQLSNTPLAQPGPPLPPGQNSFLRVREILVDSDGDGLLDVDELAAPHPTDPLDNDSDNDGQYDGEPNASSDPALADEDDDGVPDAEDAVPYDKDILWPRLRLQYAWAPLPDGWMPISVNNKGQALCVKKDASLAPPQSRWSAARLTDGVLSSTQVVFHEQIPTTNPAVDIRYQLRPLAMADDGTALFGAGEIRFPTRRWNIALGNIETAPQGAPQSTAWMNAAWLPNEPTLHRVFPPDQASEPLNMVGRLNSTALGSQAPQNVLALVRSHAGLMDGLGRLYSGLGDTMEWPFSARSNFVAGNSSPIPASFQSRVALGSGLIWQTPDGPTLAHNLPEGPRLAFWHPAADLGGSSYRMRSYDAVSRGGRAVWRERMVSPPYDPSSLHEASAQVSHTFGTVTAGELASSPPVVVPITYTPALPTPTPTEGFRRNYHAIADMPDFPAVTQDPLTQEVLPRTDGPLVISREYETFIRRKVTADNPALNAPHLWKKLNLRRTKNAPVIDGIDFYDPEYSITTESLRLWGTTNRHIANALGQVLAYRREVWQNGTMSSLADLCQPPEAIAAVPITSRLQHVWHHEINDEGLIPAEAWKYSGTDIFKPVFGAGGLCVPYEFEFPETLEIGAEIWASLSLPEHFLTTRSAQLSWWKKPAQSSTYTLVTDTASPVVSDDSGRFAFPVKAATGTTAPYAAIGDLPNAIPGDTWQARLLIPRYGPGQGGGGANPVWFTCYSPPVKIIAGPPHTLEIETPLPSGNNAWVADNQSETPISVVVKDRKNNLVADGTEVSMDLYGTASTRPIHGSEAPAEAGDTPPASRPVFLTANGRVTLTFRTFLTTSATAVIRSGTAEKELTIEYRGVAGTLTSQHATLLTKGTPGHTTTAVLSLTTPVADDTPVIWTVSRYAPGGVPDAASIQEFDSARRTVEGRVTGNHASLPINAAGAATGLCVVTATVAEKLFIHTIAFTGGVSFSANLDREVLVNNLGYQPGGARDSSWNPSQWGGESGSVQLSTAAQGTIQGVAGRAYQIRFRDPYGPGNLNLAADAASAGLPTGDTLHITADGSGIGRFHLRSVGSSTTPRYSGCVFIEVKDSTSGETSLLQTGTGPLEVAAAAVDMAGAFLGVSDPTTAAGIAGSMAGGFFIVGDIGALGKNAARAAGAAEGEFDFLESGLALTGIVTSAGVAAGGIGIPFETVINTLRAIRGIAPKLFRVIARDAAGMMKGTSNAFQSKELLQYVAAQLADGTTGLARLQALERCFGNADSIRGYHELTNALGGKSLHILTGAIDAFPTGRHSGHVVEILAALKPNTLADLAAANPTELAGWSSGLAKLLALAPGGNSTALDIAQINRVFENKHLFRHPIPGKASSYTQTDLLKELALVSNVADGDGIIRLIKALKSGSKRVSGNRYALSIVADLVKTEGATAVQCVNKYAGRRGGTDLDIWCTIGGQMRIIEVKSTLKAFGSLNSHRAWLRRVKTGWSIGPALPRIEYRSPLALEDAPGWLREMVKLPNNTGIFYVPSILFK